MARVSVATKASNSALVVVTMMSMVSVVSVPPVPVRTVISTTIVPAIVWHHDATAEQRRYGNQQCENGFHDDSPKVTNAERPGWLSS